MLETYDCFYYYRPLTQLIRRGISLGFGNTNFELLFQHEDLGNKYADVLAPGPYIWCSMDGEMITEVLTSLSICERFKLEVKIFHQK